MRLLNINTGYLETVNIEEVIYKSNLYIAISHKWLRDEINLLDLGLVGLGKKINIGEKLYDNLYEKLKSLQIEDIIKIQNTKNDDIKNIFARTSENYQKWDNYLNFFDNKKINKENINNHYKLTKIINCVFKNDNFIEYIWMDTLCIDKSSSVELNENIVSMFKIYKYANKVHVYLCNKYIKNYKSIMDFESYYEKGFFLDKEENELIKNILNDEWFARGWTLQEYLANAMVKFYDTESNFICTNKHIRLYAKNTNEDIPSYLYISENVYVGTILNWMSRRQVTKEEDIAYSLMGLLNSYIIPIYGEGRQKAMKRLLKEYIRKR